MKTKTYGQHSFSNQGPLTWNELMLELMLSPNNAPLRKALTSFSVISPTHKSLLSLSLFFLYLICGTDLSVFYVTTVNMGFGCYIFLYCATVCLLLC